MAARISGPRTDVDGLSDLAALWKELHRHHQEVAEYRGLVPDLGVSWARRLSWYRRLVTAGASWLTATADEGELIGYAMVGIEDGPDDTFNVDRGTAEVVTLVVSPGQRSAGVGQALLRAAEDIARRRGSDAIKVAVMSGNARAQQFYTARGYVIAEHVLYRRLRAP